MFRIGIIGSENSHAIAFSKLINLPCPITGEMLYPDMRVVGIYGEDAGASEKIFNTAGLDFIAKGPEDFNGRVDAMMITSRKGSLHSRYALPFIENGMPLFIDKPFTSDVREAKNLIEVAQKSGSKLCGGSGCKHSYDVLMLKNKIDTLAPSGEIISAAINFAADPASEYDGFYFYSPHLTEMTLAIFGSGFKGVTAFENNGSRVCVLRRDDFDITLHFTRGGSESSALLFTRNGNIHRRIDISMISRHETDLFSNMLRTGKMPGTYEELVTPIRIIDAIERSVKEGKTISLDL